MHCAPGRATRNWKMVVLAVFCFMMKQFVTSSFILMALGRIPLCLPQEQHIKVSGMGELNRRSSEKKKWKCIFIRIRLVFHFAHSSVSLVFCEKSDSAKFPAPPRCKLCSVNTCRRVGWPFLNRKWTFSLLVFPALAFVVKCRFEQRIWIMGNCIASFRVKDLGIYLKIEFRESSDEF